jgi:hypothetical protein
MRGLMAKPSGKIIETPIKANFREGLKVLEYFSSTHGARKGLADTALKTADAGYLTRKLTDVAQNVVITTEDCGTLQGTTKGVVYKGEKVVVTLAQAIRGRVSLTRIMDVVKDEVVVREGEVITEDVALRIESLGYEKVGVRSPLTCESGFGVCSKCYGMDLSRGALAERGLAIGIIAAQSIGEPGTQLTMRTFHIGGTASRAIESSETKAKRAGKIAFSNLKVVKNSAGAYVALNRNGEMRLLDARNKEIDRYAVPTGSTIFVSDEQEVKPGDSLCKWDPHHVPILSEFKGKVRYEDLIDGKTLRIERDARRGTVRKQVIEHKGDLHPQIVLEDSSGNPLALYPIPERAYLEVEEGAMVGPGELLAKTARDIQGTQDITGGLPRVTELFEARRPKDPAVVSEIDGVVELGEKKRGKRTILVKALGAKNEVLEEREHSVPQTKHLRVHKGDEVRAGEALVDGPLDPHDILSITGEEEVQAYLLREIQSVYRSQGVTIDDKHIEIIVSQMMRKVSVKDPGDSEFLPGAVVDRFRFRRENEKLKKERKKPATGETLLLGITKASLSSESFISAASFQETTKVLTEAAIAGKRDGHGLPRPQPHAREEEHRLRRARQREPVRRATGGLGPRVARVGPRPAGRGSQPAPLGRRRRRAHRRGRGDARRCGDSAARRRSGRGQQAGSARGVQRLGRGRGRHRGRLRWRRRGWRGRLLGLPAAHIRPVTPVGRPSRRGAARPGAARERGRGLTSTVVPVRCSPLFLTVTYADDQSTGSQAPRGPEATHQVARAGCLPPKAWGLPAGQDHDPEEAELGAAQDRARPALERQGSDRVHPGRRPQPAGALGGADPRRPRARPPRCALPHRARHARRLGCRRSPQEPLEVRHQAPQEVAPQSRHPEPH